VAYFLWRRQAKRRKAHPASPGWPIYLGVVELVFLTAFFVSVSQIADALTTATITPKWTDLLAYGGIVVFHWWAERSEPPVDDAGELPRLLGSGVAVVALTVGAIGTLTWLLSEGYDSLFGLGTVPEPAIPLALTLVSAPIWGWRWLPAWSEKPSVFRGLYLSAVTALSSIVAIGAGVTMAAVLLSFVLGQGDPAADQFSLYPAALGFGIVGGALWMHHRRRFGPGRTGAIRGYEYTLAAAGLGAVIGAVVALINLVFEQRLAGTGETVVALGCSAVAAGLVWAWFWRKAQAAPRDEEIRALQRRMYLIGMAVITGLTAAGALIGSLVVVFRAILDEVGDISDSLRLPLTLTIVSGLAAWHLFTNLRADGAGHQRVEVKPFTVTIICSHPGSLTSLFPHEANTRVLYRADTTGVVDDQMAAEIVAAVTGRSSLVWVDESGFRVALARES
jgi:hypothetical protein